ncbi:MAG: hypothetical protein AAF268_02770 [Cyanobacteria bacterium P01_A01_bin.3]
MPDRITFNLDTGAVSFDCPLDTIHELNSALDTLGQRLKAVATDPKSPQAPVEFRYTDGMLLELFCNPNIWPSPFAAKLNMTLKTERVRLSTELLLSQMREDISQYLERQ